MQSKGNIVKKNVVLRIATYKRLEKYKIELVNESENPKVTFENAISRLLDEHDRAKGNLRSTD